MCIIGFIGHFLFIILAGLIHILNRRDPRLNPCNLADRPSNIISQNKYLKVSCSPKKSKQIPPRLTHSNNRTLFITN